MRRDDLEQGLHAGLDRDHLAVYADELQRLGDPRGELITIDLHIDDLGARRPSVELSDRKCALIASLLGPEIARHPAIRCRYGFLELIDPVEAASTSRIDPPPGRELADPSIIDAVLRGPFGRYLRVATLVGPSERVRDLMTMLAEQSRPFLTQLAIHGQSWLNRVPLSLDLVRRVARAVPRLHTLEVSGRQVLPAAPFPTVRHVIASGYDALAALRPRAPGPPCFPMAGSLDLGIGWPHGSSELEGMLPPHQLPELTRLDVVRCDGPMGRDPSHDVFRFLRGLAIAPQLERLRVPTVATDEQARDLQAAIDRMPALTELVVVGWYGAVHALRHATAVIDARRHP